MNDRTTRYFYLRRLHSLTGVVPIGLFLLDHFFTNSFSWTPEAFNAEVKKLNTLPLVKAIEALRAHCCGGSAVGKMSAGPLIVNGWK